MLVLHPKILESNGIKQFAILPINEYEQIKEELHDFEDLKTLRSAKEKEGDSVGYSIEDAKKELGLIE